MPNCVAEMWTPPQLSGEERIYIAPVPSATKTMAPKRKRGTAALVFMIEGSAENATTTVPTTYNEEKYRIVL